MMNAESKENYGIKEADPNDGILKSILMKNGSTKTPEPEEPQLKNIWTDLEDSEYPQATKDAKPLIIVKKYRVDFPIIKSSLLLKTGIQSKIKPINYYKCGSKKKQINICDKLRSNREILKIHTAIIIDDDDESEKKLFEKLQKKRKLKKLPSLTD